MQASRKMPGVSQGKKLRLSKLQIPLPVDDNQWFWKLVDRSRLRLLLVTGYENISHGLVCAMCERWHEETNSFHLPVGEMTITLDDVVSLLDIPVAGRLIQDDDLHPNHGVEMLVDHLMFVMGEAVGQVHGNSGAFITYTALKKQYETLSSRCNHLGDEEDLSEEEEELSCVRPACVKTFLLLLLGYILFAGKNSKTISLL